VGRIEVIVEGLALWVDRGTFWDVLFPVCQETPSDQHYPTLRVLLGGWEVLPEVALKKRMLDLIHLVPGYAGMFAADWMLPIRPSNSRGTEARLRPNSKHVFASLRLPKRPIYPVSGVALSEVQFDGSLCKVDFGTLWTAETAATGEWLVLRKQKDAAEQRSEFIATHGQTLRLMIRNQTKAEQGGITLPNQPGDLITEAGDLIELAGSKQSLPILTENAPRPRNIRPDHSAHDLRSRADLKLVVNPYRLCPQGYCEDCPDD
jgi:hypothetical protein